MSIENVLKDGLPVATSLKCEYSEETLKTFTE